MSAILFITLCAVLGFLLVPWVGLRYRFLVVALLLAFLFRLSLVFLSHYNIFFIPGSNADAMSFTSSAFAWSQLPWGELLDKFNPRSAYSYSAFGAAVMKLTGFHPLIMPMMNLVAGMVVVALTAIICLKLWGRQPATLAALLMGLYPFAAFNSVIALREEFSILFFVIGLYFIIKWVRYELSLGVHIGLLFFSLSTMLHAGWVAAIIGVGVYSLYLVFSGIFKIIKNEKATRNYVGSFVSAFSVLLLSIFLAMAGGVTLGKGIEIGTEDSEDLTEVIESRFAREGTGGSAYPSFVATGNPYTQPWLIPARMVYFLFSPFPWDIRSPNHLAGFISSALYLFLSWRFYKAWGGLSKNKKEECLVLLLIFGALTFVFALGVSNIGTAIRHKTKFFSLLVILAAASFSTFKIRLRRA